MKTGHDLLLYELGGIMFAEVEAEQLFDAIEPLVLVPQVRERLVEHARETREVQVQNLQGIFEALTADPVAKPCPSFTALHRELDVFRGQGPEPEVLELFAVSSLLKGEHYEISAYRSAIALASALGEQDVVELLRANLAQEERMASDLEAASQLLIRQHADTLVPA